MKTIATRFAITAFYAALAAFDALAAEDSEYAFITCTDYETGYASVVWLGDPHEVETEVTPIHSDAVARWFQGLIYVVNRQNGDNIQIIDPSGGFSTIRQFSTGNGTNPCDIALLTPSKAYITRYDANELLIMNPLTGETRGTIDLSPFVDTDGLCEMDKLLIIRDILFVSIQRLDRNNWWGPAGESYLAVIDCAADTLIDADPAVPGVQGIELYGNNPFSDIVFDNETGLLYVSCVGWWGITDCGVEAVDPVTYSPMGVVLSESSASGDINDFELLDASKGYAIITNSSFNTELVRFDRSTGLKTGTLYAPGAYVLNDIELSPYGELFLTDQAPTAPGIRIFDTSTDVQITSSPLDMGLPPFDITFSIPDPVTGIPAVPADVLGPSYPNPFNPVTMIPFTISRSGKIDIAIFDAAGRRIRTLAAGFRTAGSYTLAWDGIDDYGNAVSSGIYFASMRSEGFSSAIKLVMLR